MTKHGPPQSAEYKKYTVYIYIYSKGAPKNNAAMDRAFKSVKT